MNVKGRVIRETSLEAYTYLQNKAIPTLGERQKEVYDMIMSCPRPVTDMEIAKYLGYSDPNRVRPRRHELMKMGLIEEVCKRKCSVTGRKALCWRTT